MKETNYLNADAFRPSNDENNFCEGTFSILDTPEMFPLLPALANRLGVKSGDHGGRVFLGMKDGTQYDLFALINAFLDRADALTPQALS